MFVAVLAAEVGFVRLGLSALGGAALSGVGLWLASVGVARRPADFARLLSWARLAERLAPELGTSATSAVDLERQLAAPTAPFSRTLAAAHLESATARLAGLELAPRLERYVWPAGRRALLVAAGSLALAGLALVAASDGRHRLALALLHPGAAELVDAPLVGDVRIIYHYPAYTSLPTRTVEGGDGSITAVTGTDVELFASADVELRKAALHLEGSDGAATEAIEATVSGRKIGARFTILRDGRYRILLQTKPGDRLEERVGHPVRATADAYPEVTMLAPQKDVEVREHEDVTIDYVAKDDFGVGEVTLVIELSDRKEPVRVRMAGGGVAEPRREGRYRWQLATLQLAAGSEGRFYLEAADNDALNGPKRGASVARRLVLWSAAKHHDEILARQQRALDDLVDWLGADLGMPGTTEPARAIIQHRTLLEQIEKLAADESSLVSEMVQDELAGPEVAAAFANILEHVNRAVHERAGLVARLESTPRAALLQALMAEQRRAVAQLEKDIIYLDDLLAVQRIDELKRTAKDLLAAQRELSDLLQKYKETHDPALRAELEQRIRALKDEMLKLLARMSEIKQRLPGEYRNLEAASQLAVDDQLQRLEKSLRDGDLDAAARELEQLANMIDSMSKQLDKADQEYGGERYGEIRKQLSEFAEQFKRLEGEQRALAKRSEAMTKTLRERALAQAGASLDAFVERARKKTSEAMRALERVHEPESLYGLQDSLEYARQRLRDLDQLLVRKDFSEAQAMVGEALRHEGALKATLQTHQRQYRPGGPTPELDEAALGAKAAEAATQEVGAMLAKLMPAGADQLSRDEQRQAQNMGKKQAELEREARRLGQRMDELASEVPLFGGEPRQNLEGARAEMGQAAGQLAGGELPDGAAHGRRAAEELDKLRQALEQASKGQSGAGGLPMPLGMGGERQRKGDGSGPFNPREEVQIPGNDNRATPRFRKDLLEAAKQKPPAHYEDAVRQYYEELIR